MRKGWIVSFLALLLAATPALAGPNVLTHGADLWHTATDFSYSSFADEPIPAGFFCADSKPFTGVVQLKGDPLVTQPAGALGKIDTIVRRLDDARLDERGEGSSRIQLLALSLASTRPIDTGCGPYDVRASLAGKQPITEMKLKRTRPEGGSYIAPLELRVKLVFSPVSGKGSPLTLERAIHLGPGSASYWSYASAPRIERVKVDTDGDRLPDTYLPGPSNFKVGLASASGGSSDSSSDECYKDVRSCHCTRLSTQVYEPNNRCPHLHCIWVTIPCGWPDPPAPPADVPIYTTEQIDAMTDADTEPVHP